MYFVTKRGSQILEAKDWYNSYLTWWCKDTEGRFVEVHVDRHMIRNITRYAYVITSFENSGMYFGETGVVFNIMNSDIDKDT